MRICLGTLHASRQFTPLALMYLKAYLVERDRLPPDDITIVEFPKESTAEDIARDIIGTRPGIVALSCYVWNITKFRAACALVKAAQPEVVIVLGGPEVGPVGDAVLAANPAVDAVVKSEGEITFSEIVQAVRAGLPLRAIKGLWYRGGAEIIDTGDAPILMDLNTLPSPHQPAYVMEGRRIVSIETQRGCVFRCNFCFYNKDLSIRNRRFDLERVKREILFWLERDVVEIYLMDPIFNLKAERAKEICRFIIEHNARGVAFHAEVWAEFVDDELARLMRDANLRFLEVGLQTTDETSLAAVDRRLRMKPFLEGIGHLKRYGIPFELQLIYGLPGETVASFRRSLDFAAKLDPPELAVFPLMVLPGTELWRKAAAIGLEFAPEPPYLVRSHQDMTSQEIDDGWKIVEVLDVLGNSRTVRLMCKEPEISLSNVVDAWMAWPVPADPPDPPGRRARTFIADFCERRNLPSAFYNGCAATEFAD